MEVEFTFSGKNIAIHNLLALRKIKFIKNFLDFKNDDSFAAISINHEKELFPKYLKFLKDDCEKYSLLTNSRGKAAFYDELKEDIVNNNLYEINKEEIFESIDEYNAKANNEFINKIEESENKFHCHPDRKMKHLEVYKEKKYFYDIPLAFYAKALNKPVPNYNPHNFIYEEKINYNFFCIDGNIAKHELIDSTCIEDYFSFWEYCISQIKAITDKYIPLYEEEKIHVKNEVLEQRKKSKHTTEARETNYSLRQINIAYVVMGTFINSENAKQILKKHSQYKSVPKFLAKRINKVSDLNKLSGNKTTDTKHLNDLKAAKRLLSDMKKKQAITDIKRIISAVEISFDSKY